MAPSFNCHCAERAKPVHERAWVVFQRGCHRSAFAGYHLTRSRWSTVTCLKCCACGRTKASYVALLPDYDRIKHKLAGEP